MSETKKLKDFILTHTFRDEGNPFDSLTTFYEEVYTCDQIVTAMEKGLEIMKTSMVKNTNLTNEKADKILLYLPLCSRCGSYGDLWICDEIDDECMDCSFTESFIGWAYLFNKAKKVALGTEEDVDKEEK